MFKVSPVIIHRAISNSKFSCVSFVHGVLIEAIRLRVKLTGSWAVIESTGSGLELKQQNDGEGVKQVGDGQKKDLLGLCLLVNGRRFTAPDVFLGSDLPSLACERHSSTRN